MKCLVNNHSKQNRYMIIEKNIVAMEQELVLLKDMNISIRV